MARTRVWAVVIGAVLVVGACNQEYRSPQPTASDDGADLPAVWTDFVEAIVDAADPVGTPTADCDHDGGPYSGLPGCVPGGETATVSRVVDGDTLQLTDGREIQLIGVDAPEVTDCAGDEATRHARTRVEGERVTLHDDTGPDTDRAGRPLFHVRYARPDLDYDLGYSLVYNGLAVPYPAYAGNPRHTANIEEAAREHPTSSSSCEEPRPSDEPDRESTPPRPAVTAPDSRAPQPSASNPTAYYADCAAARAAGAAPLARGDAGYRPALDRDDDGAACET